MSEDAVINRPEPAPGVAIGTSEERSAVMAAATTEGFEPVPFADLAIWVVTHKLRGRALLDEALTADMVAQVKQLVEPISTSRLAGDRRIGHVRYRTASFPFGDLSTVVISGGEDAVW